MAQAPGAMHHIEEERYAHSRASNHMTSHAKWFDAMKPLTHKTYVYIGDDTKHKITRIENIPIESKNGHS